MAKDYAGRVIFDFSERNKSATFQFGLASWNCKSFDVEINRRLRILKKDTLAAPIVKEAGSPGVRVFLVSIGGFPLAKDDTDQVIGVGGVITLLHLRADFVIRLRGDLTQGNLGRVIAKGAEGSNMGHMLEKEIVQERGLIGLWIARAWLDLHSALSIAVRTERIDADLTTVIEKNDSIDAKWISGVEQTFAQ